MIIDTLDNFRHCLCLHPLFARVLEFIETAGRAGPADGRHEIGGGCYAVVESYLTRDPAECFLEAHRNHVDIQVMLEGAERIGVCPLARCREASPYDETRDLLKLNGEAGFIILGEGEFAVFFPRDGHMPKVRHGDVPRRVRKMVVKVPVPA